MLPASMAQAPGPPTVTSSSKTNHTGWRHDGMLRSHQGCFHGKKVGGMSS